MQEQYFREKLGLIISIINSFLTLFVSNVFLQIGCCYAVRLNVFAKLIQYVTLGAHTQ